MPLSLSFERQEDVFTFVKKAFSDFPHFDSLVATAVRNLIQDATREDIDMQFTKVIAERYLDVNSFLSKGQKQLLDSLKIILTAAAIHLFSLSDNHDVKLFNTFKELQETYPDLVDDLDPENNPEDAEEVKYLLIYRNYMMLALKLVPAKGNKLFLLRIMERLEGANQQYITGTGQKRTVTRRVSIYQREGEVVAIRKNAKRPKEIVEAEKQQKELERQMKMIEGKSRGSSKKMKNLSEAEKEELLNQMKGNNSSTTTPQTASGSPNISPPLIPLLPSATVLGPPTMELPAPVVTSSSATTAPVLLYHQPPPFAGRDYSRTLSTEEKIQKLDAMNKILMDEPYTGSFTEEIMTHILNADSGK